MPNLHLYIDNLVVVDESYITIYESSDLIDFANGGFPGEVIEKIHNPILARRIVNSFLEETLSEECDCFLSDEVLNDDNLFSED